MQPDVRWRLTSLERRRIGQSLTVLLVAGLSSAEFLYISGIRGLALVAHGLVFGATVAGTVTVVERVLFPGFLRLPFVPSVILRILLLATGVFIGFSLGLWIMAVATNGFRWNDPRAVEFMRESLLRRDIRQTGIFIFIALVVYSAFSQLTRRLGPGLLGDLIIGRYHKPREEARAFLFLDLKDSTGLAERLGERDYSALLRDFFSDLTPAILETQAQVVHYVGDEAVLTWPLRHNRTGPRALRCYMIAKQTLADRQSQFQAKYGVGIDFKAALHGGRVMVTDVGDVKTERVFHGDVMNTTARILSLCNPLNEDFLTSNVVCTAPASGWKFVSLGEHRLRGKEQPLEILALRRDDPTLGPSGRLGETAVEAQAEVSRG